MNAKFIERLTLWGLFQEESTSAIKPSTLEPLTETKQPHQGKIPEIAPITITTTTTSTITGTSTTTTTTAVTTIWLLQPQQFQICQRQYSRPMQMLQTEEKSVHLCPIPTSIGMRQVHHGTN